MSPQQRPFPPQHGGAEKASPFRRVFTLNLSVTTLIGAVIVLILGVGWVFAFGVIVGRGFNPEQKMPGLGRLTPQGNPAAEADPSIIKAEDLNFFSDLKSKPLLSTDPAPAPRPDPKPTKPGTPAAPKQDSPAADARAAAASPASPAVASPAATATEPKSARYNFVFQVIAYKKPEQADAFREKLENAGLRTRLNIEKDSRGKNSMYRILVLAKGTEADAENIRAVLAKNGVKNAVLSSKQQIGGK